MVRGEDDQLLPGIISSVEEEGGYAVLFRAPENRVVRYSEEELVHAAVLDIPAMSTDKVMCKDDIKVDGRKVVTIWL